MPSTNPSLPSYLQQQAYLYKLAKARTSSQPTTRDIPSIIDWGEEYFYIPETKRPIILQPVQKRVLSHFFERGDDGLFRYRTGFYSTIKKSGKTTIAALFLRWAAESWGEFLEIYHMGNKLGQAKERGFKIARRSIELSPPGKRAEWDITATRLTHLPTHNMIAALPVNAAGEAGGNQAATAWTEIHGFVYEESERMWTEMQPVATQPLSFRFAESYAGYENESLLERRLWDRALAGKRIDDEFPIYATDDGLIAYIDTGEEARRMPWQTADYYARAAAEETPSEFRRLHLNEWIASTDNFVPMAWWDACQGDTTTSHNRVVVGVDAAALSDYFAIVTCGVRYLDDGEQETRGVRKMICVKEVQVFKPPEEGAINFSEVEEYLTELSQRFDVVQIAYDPHEMHHMVQRLLGRISTWFYEFKQGEPRLMADRSLYDMIRDRHIVHDGNDDLAEAIGNCNAKTDAEGSALRLVKKNSMPTTKIDAAVALSMAAFQANYLEL